MRQESLTNNQHKNLHPSLPLHSHAQTMVRIPPPPPPARPQFLEHLSPEMMTTNEFCDSERRPSVLCAPQLSRRFRPVRLRDWGLCWRIVDGDVDQLKSTLDLIPVAPSPPFFLHGIDRDDPLNDVVVGIER